jgi:hypothetical protein
MTHYPQHGFATKRDTSAQLQDSYIWWLIVTQRCRQGLSQLTVASPLLNSDYAVAKGNQ